jgi:DNA-binding response OmpR family regulator
MNEAQGDDALGGKRILVVEDEYYIADDIVRALRSRGADVVGPFATLAQAERIMDKGALDFAVLDINLRGEMSYPVADRLAALGVPFLFATGYSIEAIPDRFSTIPTLQKPVDPDMLARLIPATIDSIAA